MKQPKPQDNWIQDFRDFYWESGKYAGREHGIDGYLDFIRTLLAEQRQAVRERASQVREV